jgi:hypothetical protein
MPNSFMSAPSAQTKQAINNLPVEIDVSQQMAYINLADAYVDEVMPSMAGRVGGQIVALLSAFAASRFTQALTGVTLVGLAKRGLSNATKEVLKESAKTIAVTQAPGSIAQSTSTMARLVRAADDKLGGALSSVVGSKHTAYDIIFWSALGIVEDIYQDAGHFAQLLGFWRRKTKFTTAFAVRVQKDSDVLAAFVNAIEADAWQSEMPIFTRYISDREKEEGLEPFVLNKEDLVFDFLWIDAVRRWHREETTPRGSEKNPHLIALQTQVAALIFAMEKAGIEDGLSFSPAYPVCGVGGLPKSVVETLRYLAIESKALRAGYEELGFVDSEFAQSIGTTFFSVASKVGVEVATRNAPGGFLKGAVMRGALGKTRALISGGFRVLELRQ